MDYINEQTFIYQNQYNESKIHVIAYYMGADLHLSVFGGDVAHIGAVSVWDEKEKNVQTISLPGHKEHVVTEKIAKMIGQTATGKVCVEAGMHYEHFNQYVLERVERTTNQIVLDLLNHFTELKM